jgi:hypothetical protein
MSSIIACPCLGPLARLASTSKGGSEKCPIFRVRFYYFSRSTHHVAIYCIVDSWCKCQLNVYEVNILNAPR